MSEEIQKLDDPKILSIALNRSAKAMDINDSELSEILSVDSSTLEEILNCGVEPNSDAGQLCKLLIKIHLYLASSCQNDLDYIQHFIHSENKYFEAKPIDKMKLKNGCIEIIDYLNAMKGKV